MQEPKDKGRAKTAKHKTERFASRICGAADKEGLAPGQFFDALMLAYVAVASSMPDSMGSCSMQLSADDHKPIRPLADVCPHAGQLNSHSM